MTGIMFMYILFCIYTACTLNFINKNTNKSVPKKHMQILNTCSGVVFYIMLYRKKNVIDRYNKEIKLYLLSTIKMLPI